MKNFQDKVAVITGGASGFGREFALKAHSLGMQLVLADVQQDALDTTVAELRAAGAQVIGVLCDVRKAAEVQALADAAMGEFGAVHLVFTNAGVGFGGLLWEATEADWDWVMGVNVSGVVHGVRIFTALMLECARASGLDLPVSRLHAALLAEAVEQGRGELDNAAIVLQLRGRPPR